MDEEKNKNNIDKMKNIKLRKQYFYIINMQKIK